ncbi:LytR/AlgR family response regulator transcription factor [Spirosoma litoris]
MYSCLIVDDDPLYVDYLVGNLKETRLFDEYQLVTTAFEAIEKCREFSFDIVFLDLQLPDLSGLDLIRAISSFNVTVVVVSSLIEEAVMCFELGVVDFLKKNFSYDRLMLGISRALKNTIPKPQERSDKAVSILQKTTSHYFKSGRRIEHIATDEVFYIEGFGVYCKIHIKNTFQLINIRLSEVESQLSTKGFIRVHKSFIINTVHIKRFDGKHIWIDDRKLPIGLTYRTIVNDFMASSMM